MILGIIFIIVALVLLGLGVANLVDFVQTPSWRDGIWATVLLIGGALLMTAGANDVRASRSVVVV